MRQAIISRHGGPEVLTVREAPDPSPGPGQVRIRTGAAGVNFADILARLGLYPDAPKPPCVVGYEVAGRVDQVGANVTAFEPGDRVFALTAFGGYADVVIAPVAHVFRLPDQLSEDEGAAIPVNYLTAAIALDQLAHVTAGETVLVHNAGGGVGIAALQLAARRRATVIGTASAAKHPALRALGYDHLIDYRTADVEAEVRRITGARGVDVVLDPIGGRSFGVSYRLLAPLGRLVMFGVSDAAPAERRSWPQLIRTWWRLPRFEPLRLISRNRGVFGLHLGRLWTEEHRLRALMDELVAEFGAGRLKTVIARRFPLAEVADAHRYLQSRRNIGKVILTT